SIRCPALSRCCPRPGSAGRTSRTCLFSSSRWRACRNPESTREALRRLFTGAQRAFACDSIQIVAATVQRPIPTREAFSNRCDFLETPGTEFGEPVLPAHHMREELAPRAQAACRSDRVDRARSDLTIVHREASELRRVGEIHGKERRAGRTRSRRSQM